MVENWTASTQSACPQCGATIEVNPAFVPWCESCNWNVHPIDPPAPRGLIAMRYAELGNALGRGLFEEMKAAPSLRPRLTRTLVAALLLASAVHLLTVLCFVGGLYLIVSQWPFLPAVLAGALMMLVAVYLAARPARVSGTPIRKESFPALFETVSTIAASVGAPAPHHIVLDIRFNASYRRVGWRNRVLLTVGLPLLGILDEREYTALIGHEMAHGVNGDFTRSFFVGSAIASLVRWHSLLSPAPTIVHTHSGFTGLAAMLMRPIQIAVAQLPRALALLLVHLLWRDSQRAEYLADDLAARAAGTEAMIALLGKLQLSTVAEVTVQNVAMSGSSQTILALLAQRCLALPLHEKKRLDAVSRLESSRLDVTHPPTGLRIALLEARQVAVPSVHLAANTWRAVEDEIAATDTETTRLLVDQYRSRLYRH